MAFRDLDEFLIVEKLDLPIRGKVYSFPGEISARSWLLVQRVGEQFQAAARAKARGEDYSPETEVLDDESYAGLSAELFGGVDAEMAADGLTSAHIKLAFATLLAYHLSGREAAETVWNAQGVPLAPNLGDEPRIRNEVDPVSGLPRWIERPPDESPDGRTWADILRHWGLIEADLHERYGLDCGSGLLKRRSGRWLRVRILGLLSVESRLRYALFPPEKK